MCRRVVVIAAAMIVVTSVPMTGCESSGGTSAIGVGSVTIGVYGSGVYCASIYVAREQGRFASEGVKVTLKEYDSGASAIEGLLAGEVELACASEYVLALNFFEHPDLRIVSELCTSKNSTRLVLRGDTRISDAGGLVGHKIGTVKGTSGEYYLDTLLALHGVESQEVDTVFMTPQEVAGAVTSGQLDGAMIWDPIAAELAAALGDNALIMDGQTEQRFYWVLAGTEEYLSVKAATVETVLRALVRTEEASFDDVATAQAVFAEATEQPLQSVTQGWQEFRMGVLLSEGLGAALVSEMKWLVSKGAAAGDEWSDPTSLLHLRALMAVEPDSVTVMP